MVIIALALLAVLGTTVGIVAVVVSLVASADRTGPRGPGYDDGGRRDAVPSGGGSVPGVGSWLAGAHGDAERLAALARSLELVEVAPGRLQGQRRGLPVTVHQVRPTLRIGGGTSAKTGIETGFATVASAPFRLSGRGAAVVGAQVVTGDPEFDRRFVIRSSTGPAVLELFGETVRKVITAYGEAVPVVDVTERRVRVLIEGPLPEPALIERLIDLQVEVVAALTDA